MVKWCEILYELLFSWRLWAFKKVQHSYSAIETHGERLRGNGVARTACLRVLDGSWVGQNFKTSSICTFWGPYGQNHTMILTYLLTHGLLKDRCKSNNSSSQHLEGQQQYNHELKGGAAWITNHQPARGPHRASNACQPRHRGCGLLCACHFANEVGPWCWVMLCQLPGMHLPAASAKDWPVRGSSSPSYEGSQIGRRSKYRLHLDELPCFSLSV